MRVTVDPLEFGPVSVGSGLGFVSGSLAGRVFPLGPRVQLGRDPRAEVSFPPDEAGVSTRHAQITVEPSGVRITDLQSRGGTFLNGERIPPDEAVPLPWGSVVRFGTSGPVAVVEALVALEEGGQPLVLKRDDGAGGQWPLSQPALVGRDSSCTVQLDPQRDSVASSRHVHLTPAFGRVVVTDLASANGTWCRGRRVAQCVLGPGDVLTLGQGGPVLRVDRDDPRRRTEKQQVRREPERPAAPAPRTPAPTPAPRLDARAADPRGTGSRQVTSSPQPPARRPAEPAPLPAPAVPEVKLEAFRLELTGPGGERGRIHALIKTTASLGTLAGLNDLVLRCFPRDLENDKDALDRSEPLGVEHATLVLGGRTVELVDLGAAPTKVNGTKVQPNARVPLGELTDLVLGDDTLGFRARVFSHPRLQPREPVLGVEGMHPVECCVLERKGDGADHLYLLLVRQASIGSADDCAIVCPYPGVAPLHALLFVKDGQPWISQLGDAPVSVGEVKLGPGLAVPLQPGVRASIGSVTLAVHESAPEDFHPDG